MKNYLLKCSVVLAFFASLIGLSSCGDDNVALVSSKINGPLGEYFEVVDKPYKVNKTEAKNSISVEIKRTKDGGPTEWWLKSARNRNDYGFTVELMDNDENVLVSKTTTYFSDSEQLIAIIGLEEGESTSLKIEFESDDDKENASKAQKVRVTSHR
ncbi:MAG: hypothetical protein J6X22_04405 [Muribaculaceae bacterium]|nr:hypothetical protein [Muribaculaceae bacterium]